MDEVVLFVEGHMSGVSIMENIDWNNYFFGDETNFSTNLFSLMWML
jgi:hypothetical protein